jgi:hypothetical protein
VRAIEAAMEALSSGPHFAKVDLARIDWFWGGIYARAILIPKGCILTGRIHKFPNMNFLAFGDLEVAHGGEIVRVQGPKMVLSPPGTKRVARAHSDCMWITLLPTHENDPEVCERLFTAASEEEYQQFLALSRAEMPKCLS